MKKIFLLLFLGTLTNLAVAQKTTELGILIGRSYYLGEINPSTHIGNGTGSLNYGIAFRYNLNRRYALKAALSHTQLGAKDEAMKYEFNKSRKAEFENSLTDFATNIEFNFLPYAIGDENHFFTPYLFVGFNLYRSRPEAYINEREVIGSTVEKTLSFAYSFGSGIKLNIGKKISLNFEWGFRKTGNDYIDGLPNRENDIVELGKTYNNDWFVSSNFMLTYRLTDFGPCPAYNF